MQGISYLATPLPANYYGAGYEGLVYFNNSFITIQNTPPDYHFIRFNTTTILSNTSVPSDPQYWNTSTYLEYNDFIGLQQFNNTLYALRYINTGVGIASPDKFILCEYSLPDLALTKDFIVSTHLNNQTTSTYPTHYNHLFITSFIIDNQGNFWFRFQLQSINYNRNYITPWAKVNPTTLQLVGSLQVSPAGNFNPFYENVTIQSATMGNYNLTTRSTASNVWSFPLAIQNNHFIEVLTATLGYGYSHSFLGFRVSQITKLSSPVFNYVVLAVTTGVAIMGIVFNYRLYRLKKRISKLDRST